MKKNKRKLNLIKDINVSAIAYENMLKGNSYLFIFKNKCIEVGFYKECFRHLTGLESSVTADKFYKLAKENKLQEGIIRFGTDDYRTCLKKIKNLPNLSQLTQISTICLDDINTLSMGFEFGITDLKLTLLLHKNTSIKDNKGYINPNIYLPSSFRVGGDVLSLSKDCEFVDCVMQKKCSNDVYTSISYKDKDFDIRTLPTEIKIKISKELLENEIEKMIIKEEENAFIKMTELLKEKDVELLQKKEKTI